MDLIGLFFCMKTVGKLILIVSIKCNLPKCYYTLIKPVQVTVVENLDVFGIDAKEFSHRVQIKVACSATVKESPQKNQGPHVHIQGNQVNCVQDLLTSITFTFTLF